MTKFDQTVYNQFLLDNDVVGFFEQPITLKSGRISNWYANCRNLLDTVGLMERLTDFILAYIDSLDIKYDYLYGVPEGATKLGIILNYKKGGEKQKLVMGRGKPKDHGAPKDKYFVGPVEQGDRVIVVEDVTTTGGSLIETIKQLTEASVRIVAAIGLFNRMEKRDDGKSVQEAIERLGIKYYSLSDAFQLLPLVVDKVKPADDVLRQIEEYFNKYGVMRIKFG